MSVSTVVSQQHFHGDDDNHTTTTTTSSSSSSSTTTLLNSNNNSNSGNPVDDYVEDLCPICIEPFDDTDLTFLPCACNYRVCMFCVRRIRTEFDGRCPGCRKDYSEASFRFEKVDPVELERKRFHALEASKRNKNRGAVSNIQDNRRPQQQAGASTLTRSASSSIPTTKQPPNTTTSTTTAASTTSTTTATITNTAATLTAPKLRAQQSAPLVATRSTSDGMNGNNFNTRSFTPSLIDRGVSPGIGTSSSSSNNTGVQQLNVLKGRAAYANVTVTHTELVEILGLSPSVAKESTLRLKEYFGQYGTILSVVVDPSQDPSSPRVMVLYSSAEEAAQTIESVNGFVLDGRSIRASLGKAKFCRCFLTGHTCRDSRCIDIHNKVQVAEQDLVALMSSQSASGVASSHAPLPPPSHPPTKLTDGTSSSSSWNGHSTNSSLLSTSTTPAHHDWNTGYHPPGIASSRMEYSSSSLIASLDGMPFDDINTNSPISSLNGTGQHKQQHGVTTNSTTTTTTSSLLAMIGGIDLEIYESRNSSSSTHTSSNSNVPIFNRAPGSAPFNRAPGPPGRRMPIQQNISNADSVTANYQSRYWNDITSSIPSSATTTNTSSSFEKL